MSANFSLDELCFSEYAARHNIPNKPMPRIVENIEQVLMPGLEEVRALLKCPMIVSSGFRSQAVNDAVGGSLTSQHRYGLACDFRAPAFGSPFEVCKAIEASGIKFDQLIHEYGQWCHISFVRTGPRRGHTLTTYSPGRYTPGITQRT